MEAGVVCGDSSFDRQARVWHTRLDCGAGEQFDIKAVTPSPGIRVLIGDPGDAPEIASTPEKWYKTIEGDSKSNIFRKVERVAKNLVEDGFFRLDPAGAEWWTRWLESHRPRCDDGGSDATDAASTISLSWPRRQLEESCARADSAAVADASERRIADQVEYSGYSQAQRARAQAHLDESSAKGDIVAVVGQLAIVMYTYDDDESNTRRVALGKVLSVAGSSTETRVYQMHWQVRAEANAPLNSFSVNGRYRPARKGDWRGGVEDQSVFQASPADFVCVLARTRRKGADVVEEPLTALNESGTIPNFKLATGVKLREYITTAIADQGDLTGA